MGIRILNFSFPKNKILKKNISILHFYHFSDSVYGTIFDLTFVTKKQSCDF